MRAIGQNNRYGTIIIVEGRRVEIATEDEAYEYLEDIEWNTDQTG